MASLDSLVSDSSKIAEGYVVQYFISDLLGSAAFSVVQSDLRGNITVSSIHAQGYSLLTFELSPESKDTIPRNS